MLETLHPLARQLVAEYLGLADAHLPGVVEGLYLVGSIALDDFQASDVDFVASPPTSSMKSPSIVSRRSTRCCAPSRTGLPSTARISAGGS
jgi:hypothetical protein